MLVRVLQQFLLENFGHILTVNQRKVDEKKNTKETFVLQRSGYRSLIQWGHWDIYLNSEEGPLQNPSHSTPLKFLFHINRLINYCYDLCILLSTPRPV